MTRRTLAVASVLAIATIGLAPLRAAGQQVVSSNQGGTGQIGGVVRNEQGEATAPRTWGYAFGGFGRVYPEDKFTFWRGRIVDAGGGVEHRFSNRFGLLGEVAWGSRLDVAGVPDHVLTSFNGSYHVGTSALTPFVTAGFTLVDAAAGFGVNIGVGVNYWVNDHIAARIEFRNHAWSADAPLNTYSLRFGLSFR